MHVALVANRDVVAAVADGCRDKEGDGDVAAEEGVARRIGADDVRLGGVGRGHTLLVHEEDVGAIARDLDLALRIIMCVIKEAKQAGRARVRVR